MWGTAGSMTDTIATYKLFITNIAFNVRHAGQYGRDCAGGNSGEGV